MSENEITLDATDDDLVAGIPGDTDNCAVALAAKRVLGPDAWTGVWRTYQAAPSSSLVYVHPPELTSYIDAIDHGQYVAARSFVLRRSTRGDES